MKLAEKIVLTPIHNVELAKDTVLGSDFHYCKPTKARLT